MASTGARRLAPGGKKAETKDEEDGAAEVAVPSATATSEAVTEAAAATEEVPVTKAAEAAAQPTEAAEATTGQDMVNGDIANGLVTNGEASTNGIANEVTEEQNQSEC